jgi:colanic acid/amylovoran biosynthesis protein
MKIIITNSVPLNGGDASILLGINNIITDAFLNEYISFIIYASKADVSQRYYPKYRFNELIYYQVRNGHKVKYFKKTFCKIALKRFNFGLKLWKKGNRLSEILLQKHEIRALSEYKSADFIISTGGTYLVEKYNLEPRLFDYEVSICTGTPLIFFTQSLGPFHNPDYRYRLRKIFKNSEVIFVRDELSKQHLIELGVRKSKIFVCADAAFCLASKEKYKKLLLFDKTKKIKRVAISVRDWPYFKSVRKDIGIKNYIETMKSVVRYMIEKYGTEVVFISTCQGIPEYKFDDSVIAREILHSLPLEMRERVIVDSDFHNPEKLIEILGKFDLVIATRMHMAILSLCAGVPCFPIAYEFKTRELFKQLELEQWVCDIEKFNASSTISLLDDFINKLPDIGPLLYKKVTEAKKSSEKPGLIIKHLYNKLKNRKDYN